VWSTLGWALVLQPRAPPADELPCCSKVKGLILCGTLLLYPRMWPAACTDYMFTVGCCGSTCKCLTLLPVLLVRVLPHVVSFCAWGDVHAGMCPIVSVHLASHPLLHPPFMSIAARGEMEDRIKYAHQERIAAA
jgi:hypothetical protein